MIDPHAAALLRDIDSLLEDISDPAITEQYRGLVSDHPDQVEEIHQRVYRIRQERWMTRGAPPAAHSATVELHISGVPIDWYYDAPPRREYLLREVETRAGVLPRGKVGLFVAQGGAGKTMALCQLAVAIATDTPWLGAWQSGCLGRVLIVLGEEDLEEVQRRLYHAAKIAGEVPPDGSIEFAALSGVDCALLGKGESGDPVETPYLVALRDRIARERYDAVFMDPLARFAGGEAETQNAWATRLISVFESIAKASGATVIVAHHTSQVSRVNTGKASRPDATMARGVTGLTDGARWMAAITIEHPEDEDGNEIGEFITIALAKSNYGRCNLRPITCERSSAHEGALVPLGDERQAELRAAKSKNVAVTKNKKKQEIKDDNLLRDIERNKKKRETREAEIRKRDDDDDAAARELIAAHPDKPQRDIVAMLKAERACGTDRADDALRRVLGERRRS